ncbi:sigma-70 family RNA polymerase sigma factor [Bifidobacterium ruminantium]|uniref:sigma-70 family RNA polymerase sigma factor n=1 Tax=Bifidobacterium ruminantium TaxID=78346 RepID=UPI0024902950|nr:sigma-70 family RNA polymerase sigma factor [Bifidobacterium ruminantium]
MQNTPKAYVPLGLSIVRLLLALRRLISSSVLIGQFPTMKTDAELLPMIRRDRALRAAAEHRDEEELEFRAPQCILQELWNAEERVAHSCHRSDRVGGSAWSYEEIAGINREPQEHSLSPEELLIEYETAQEREQAVRRVLEALRTLPDGQRKAVENVYFRDLSQSDVARSSGISRAAVSKQINAAIKKLRRVCDVSVKVRSLQGDSDLTASK